MTYPHPSRVTVANWIRQNEPSLQGLLVPHEIRMIFLSVCSLISFVVFVLGEDQSWKIPVFICHGRKRTSTIIRLFSYVLFAYCLYNAVLPFLFNTQNILYM